jgi:hypothetical protein
MARLTAVVAMLAVLAPLGQAAAAPNLQCKTALETAVAPGQPSVALGFQLARETWRLSVRARFGPAWSDPVLARNVSQNCAPQPTGLGPTLFVCYYRARPCKL